MRVVVFIGHRLITHMNAAPKIEFTYNGPALDVSSELNLTCGDVQGTAAAGAIITCGDVGGDVNAGANAQISGDVGGDVNAGKSVECGDVDGDVNAGMNVTCGDVDGDVSAISVMRRKD